MKKLVSSYKGNLRVALATLQHEKEHVAKSQTLAHEMYLAEKSPLVAEQHLLTVNNLKTQFGKLCESIKILESLISGEMVLAIDETLPEVAPTPAKQVDQSVDSPVAKVEDIDVGEPKPTKDPKRAPKRVPRFDLGSGTPR